MYTWANKISQRSGSSLETQMPYNSNCKCNGIQVLPKEWAEYHKILLATTYFSSENKNLFKSLNSLKLC